MDTADIRIRAVRAALFTALCVVLSAGAHVLLSAAPLPAVTVGWLTAGVFALAFALAGTRERGFLRIAALLVPLELAADTVFTTGQHACYGASGGPIAGTLRSLGVDLLCGGGDLGTPLARMTARGDSLLTAGAVSPWLLLAAHLAVGLVGAAWLARGEAALAGLARAAAVMAFRPLLLAVAAVRTRPAVRPCTTWRTPAPAAPSRLALLSHSLARRGPPVPAPAA
ncbi:hypothetical protein SRB5_60750 [Streptomyces sp. RB5]|uniref:Integral membrane protein n=1 Tax=Streptomyces smaragdinus TaxID=2585196 RepID=A0A7K0CRC0_9ACTN|nr:hypothetical protein [Streptomyces smaragdinus]MQY15883.1 hypothetical protein [Streptomyces smaragdinus]